MMHYQPTEADIAAMVQAELQIRAEEDAENQRQRVVMATVQKALSEKAYAELIEYMADSSYVRDFQITDAPVGDEQDDGAAWGMTFVNQTTNGGYAGDDFAGTVSIPLENGKFFQFAYSM